MYHPAENRGVGLVFSRAAIGMVFGTAGAIFSEFGPDLERKFYKNEEKQIGCPMKCRNSTPIAIRDGFPRRCRVSVLG